MKWRELFDAMNVGDSVHCTAKERDAMFQAALRCGVKLSGRKQPDGAYRVWKVAVTSSK